MQAEQTTPPPLPPLRPRPLRSLSNQGCLAGVKPTPIQEGSPLTKRAPTLLAFPLVTVKDVSVPRKKAKPKHLFPERLCHLLLILMNYFIDARHYVECFICIIT